MYPADVDIALTYANEKCTDGAGAQLQRIYGIYAIARFLKLSYLHSPLAIIGYQGLAALEGNSPFAGMESRYNSIFNIPSDIALPERYTVYDTTDADLDAIERAKGEAKKKGAVALVRIVYPYTVTDQHPDIYRHVRDISPFARTQSEVFRLALHVRRGEQVVLDSDRMLPNSFYISCALRFADCLKQLKIPFACELYTELPSKRFVVTPEHHGINGRIRGDMIVDPQAHALRDFDVLPNLKKFINGDPIDTLQRLATADALVLSRSSYSYVAAILNKKCIVAYHPFWHSPLSDWLISDTTGNLPRASLVARLAAWKRDRQPRALYNTEYRREASVYPGMYFSIIDLLNGETHSASAEESLLKPFLEQSAQTRSIVALACHELLRTTRKPVLDESPLPSTLDALAEKARGFFESAAGNDLLLVPEHALAELMTPVSQEFSFRAVAVLLSEGAELEGDNAWRLRRSLFDRGLICIGLARVAGRKTLCFLASDAVTSLNTLNVEPRGLIGMSVFTEGARFANQLFRYACVKLYGLRHGLTPALPDWEGRRLFGLDDAFCAGLDLPELTFAGFSDEDRRFWDQDDPPVDVDLKGYFQELPACWRSHRPLLKRMFQLAPGHVGAFDYWLQSVTDGGRRTLVGIHVRRGDYRNFQRNRLPYLRIVPEDWYLAWLREIWPTLREPLLFIATDEPRAIRPIFHEFETIPESFGSMAQSLPDYVRDFEILRRADYLAICNSSFSRMAAILARSEQQCFLPSFQTQRFAPYEPWIDAAFWARFADSWRAAPSDMKLEGLPGPTVKTKPTLEASAEATILLDVSDLLSYVLHHATFSGIQRVQCEMLEHLLEIPHPQPLRFVAFDKRHGLGVVETYALLDLIETIRSGPASRVEIESQLRALLTRVIRCSVRPGDIFLTLGAFWTVRGMGMLLQELKNSGVTIGAFIHDIIPLTAPEYFENRATRLHVKGVFEALTFADFLFTTSEYNRTSIAQYMASRNWPPLPIHLVPLGGEPLLPAPTTPELSSAVARIVDKEYVLCVGTIEVRKNPAYLFNIWKLMVKAGRSNIPHLVFVGRKGWLVQDFLEQLKGCNYLGGKIVVLHNVTDVELEALYRKCLLTMFPSFIEGWGLPVGESLAHGKICISSAAGGTPEVGGDLVDYIDPYNANDGLQRLSRYLDDPELRRSREREIADRYAPRPWQKTADDLLKSAQALARQVRRSNAIAAIKLPPDRDLPISSDIVTLETDGMEGTLSAELIAISGWHPTEALGVRAAQPETLIRFRTDLPAGARINLALRLAAYGRDFRIRIRSGSGAETEAIVAAESEKVAVLACTVEPGKLVTAHLFADKSSGEQGLPASSSWMLKGLLYFDSKRVTDLLLKKMKGGREVRPPSPQPVTVPAPPTVEKRDSILLRSAHMDESRRAASFGAFLHMTDSYWPSESASDRGAPLFADRVDRRTFYLGLANRECAPQIGQANHRIKLVRRSDQFISTARFSEGSVFDRSGVWRAFGYLHGAPPGRAPWLSKEADSIRVAEDSLAAAPYYDHSYLVFYNGNLQNYYHWVAEGLLSLDILSRALGRDSHLKIILPKSMDINAVFDHRGTLRDAGFGEYEVIEAAENLIQVREAFWVDSDLVEQMPSVYLKDFQQRISRLYAGIRGPRNRRVLVARKGPTRKIRNLEQVQAFLSRYDFETVYLEGMSMKDQILLFQSAEFIIGPHGAGLANLLFCAPGTKVLELAPPAEVRPFFWLISEKLDLVHGLQFCPTGEAEGFQGAITVDIDKLQALVRMVNAHL